MGYAIMKMYLPIEEDYFDKFEKDLGGTLLEKFDISRDYDDNGDSFYILISNTSYDYGGQNNLLTKLMDPEQFFQFVLGEFYRLPPTMEGLPSEAVVKFQYINN